MSDKQEPMFFITCMTELPMTEDRKYNKAHRCRTFGFAPTEDIARDWVDRNACDLSETIYGYCVIERLDWGIHPIAEEVQWYKFDYEKEDRWIEIEKPKSTEGINNYALG